LTDIIGELTWRGLIAQSTDPVALRDALNGGQVTVYAGFDPTAPGLHIGNLALLLTLRRLQDAGHRPIGLVGGATGLIGDPSGRSAERQLNPLDVIADWVRRIRAEVARFLDFGAARNGALVVSNLDWTADVTAIQFLRDIGKHFSVNQMIARESVKARLDSGGISYTEFSYQILQAFDYLELYRRHGCTLQLGGSDQWGNLVGGVDLVRRVEGASVHALTIPLITRPDGSKYSKTGSGSIWLSPELTSPFAFYQFWFNVTDAEVGPLLQVYTFRGRDEIAALADETVRHPAARGAQRVLAQDVTTLVHGADECGRVLAASRALFGQGDQDDLARLDEETLAAALAEVPGVTVKVGPDAGLPPLVDLLARTGLVPSKSAARRAINAGGAYLNNRKVTDEASVPGIADLLHGRFLVLRRGPRTVAGVQVAQG
jgi:tyrosyl-tRNA synthetase